MPGVTTFETYLLSARTHSLILTATWLLDDVFAVGPRAPLFAFVLSDFDIFLYCFVFSLDLF